MLHRYSFSNVYSFREETEVSLLLSQREPASDWWIEAKNGKRVSKVMAVIGPNASGKTSLLNAMVFIHWFLTDSFDSKPSDELPFSPHGTASHEPSRFTLEFSANLDGQIRDWRYELIATQQQVLEESLFAKFDRERYVFKRHWNDLSKRYDLKEQGFGQIPSEAVNGRTNVSLVALGAQYGLPLAIELVSMQLRSNLTQMGKERSHEIQLVIAAEQYAKDEKQLNQMTRLLKAWDLGLTKIEFQDVQVAGPDGKMQSIKMPYGVHRMRGEQELVLPMMMESSGTQIAFVLLSRLLPVLQQGGIAVIDEFESDLHPHMLSPILDLFANPETNPHNAQLLFSSHSLEILNLVPKSQVTLVEKDEFNESQAWRLDEVKGIRSDDNFYAKYMAGAYGAVPRL
jgi:uncharacterized protein